MIYYLKHLEHREGKTRGDKFEVLKYVVCCTCGLVFGMFLSWTRTWVHTHLTFFPSVSVPLCNNEIDILFDRAF